MDKKSRQQPDVEAQPHVTFIAQDPPQHPQNFQHLPHAYAGPSTQPYGPSYNQQYPLYNDPFSPQAIRAADSRALKRFWSAFFYGFAIWVTLSIVFGSLGYDEMQQSKHKHRHAQTEETKLAVNRLSSSYKPNDSSLFDLTPPEVKVEGEPEGLI